MSGSLRGRLILFTLLVLAGVAAAGGYSLAVALRLHTQHTTHDLREQAATIAAMLQASVPRGPEAVRDTLAPLAGRTIATVQVEDAAGRPVAQIGEPPGPGGLTVSVPIQDGGTVRLTLSQAVLAREVRRFWLLMGLGLLIGLVVIGGGAGVFARGLLAPIRRVQSGLRAIAGGDLSYHLPDPGVSELRPLADQVNALAAQLEMEERRRTRFLSDVAHELRTPAASIQAAAEVIAQQAADAAKVTRFAQGIRRQADRLTHLTEELLLLWQFDSGGVMLSRQPEDLREILTQAAEGFLARAEQQHVTLEVRPPDDPLIVAANAGRLQQAVANLLDNALGFTPPGGRIVLEAARRDDQVEVQVHDTGVGIAAEHLPHIFDRFYKADAARAGRGGAGLGLAIVKTLIDAHGGTVSVASEVGRGTTVLIRLPLPKIIQPVTSP